MFQHNIPIHQMRTAIVALFLTLFVSPCFALDITTRDGTTYKNSEITRIQPDALVISHSTGVARVPFENLPEYLQTKYNFNPASAAEYRRQIAEAQAAATKRKTAEEQAKKSRDSNQLASTPVPTRAADPIKSPEAGADLSTDPIAWLMAQWQSLPRVAQLSVCVAVGALCLAFVCSLLKRIERERRWKRVCADSDAYFDLLDDTDGLPTTATNIIMQYNERAYYCEPSTLFETRAVRHYQSGMIGFRVARGVWVGGSQGRSISNQEWTQIDSGTLTVTNQRIVFGGARETRTIPVQRIVSVDSLRDSVDVGVANRQKSMVFGAANPLILATIIRLACKGYDSIGSDNDRHDSNGTAFSTPPPPVEPPPSRTKQRTRRSAPKPQVTESDYDIHARTLGLCGNFSYSDVKQRYYDRIKEYHPDKVAALGSKLRELAEAESKKINAAYEFFTERFTANENA